MKLQDLPIKRKLTVVIMLTTGIALLLTCAAFMLYERFTYKGEMVNHLRVIAEITADNTTSSISFGVPSDAQRLLSALKAEKHIVAAVIYNQVGEVFVQHPDEQAQTQLPFEGFQQAPLFSEGYLFIIEPIMQNGSVLGAIYLKADVQAMRDRFRSYATITFLVLLASLVLAYGVSKILQRQISEPILALSTIAQNVSEKKDYSARAPRVSADEVGALTDAFNHMLTQIDQRDAALRSSGERLRRALTASQTGTWDWDLTTNRVNWDETMHLHFGIKPREFQGTIAAFLEHILFEDRESVQRAIQRSLQERREFHADFRVPWPDGSIHHLTSRGMAFYDEHGAPRRMAGVTIDVTQSKRAEEEIRMLNTELEHRVEERTAELSEMNKELEAFTYSVSHDLRAPLRHVDAYAQILEEDYASQLPEEVRAYISRIRHGALNMGCLVDDLLNLARVGRQELQMESCPLRPMVEDVIADLVPEVKGRKIEWQIGSLPQVQCDPGLIKQVFANLISNAIKYSRPRPKAVIAIGETVVDGEPAIYVRDNGVGFSMKYVEKIFGVFQRLHRSDEFEGTGVGLATVDRIIRKHHGRVWAQAETEVGATFFFTLPGLPSTVESPG
jgi:PAS domain S-box-containing protein